jgi:hypothetical protein
MNIRMHDSQQLFRVSALTLIVVLLVQMAALQPWRAASTGISLLPDVSFNPLRLPLSFERNAGQTDQSVAFLAQGLGGTLFFRPNEVVLSLPNGSSPSPSDHLERMPHRPAASQQVLALQFLGANPAAVVTGVDRQEGTVNYLLGDDAAEWQTNITTFSSILYNQIYPGIDLRYDGAAGQLKGTYIVEPGADPALIRWQYAGAQTVDIDPSTGDLRIRVAAGHPLVEQKPVAWQEVRGEVVPVDVRYSTTSNRSVRFALGAYDPAYPLIIDPTLTYATYLGGSSADYAYDLAVDPQGSIYVTGSTASTDFPLAGPIQTKRNGFGDLFVSKLNADGSLAYSTYLGGNDSDVGFGIAVDGNGSAYVTGESWSSNFPVVNPIPPNDPGIQNDVIVFKLNPAGSTLVYSTYLGGHNSQTGWDIAVNSSGEAFLTGHTFSSTFPVVNAFQPQMKGGRDAFVARLNAAGSALVYSSFLGSNGDLDYGTAIAIDGTGHAYVTGQTYLEGFPTVNALQPVSGGFGEAFVTKVSPDGSTLVYSTYLGGEVNERGRSIAVDSQGNAYVTGPTESTNFPTVNAYQPVKRGYEDVFLAKISPAGSALVFSTYLGGSLPDGNYDVNVAVDSAGSAYLAGNTDSVDFPTANAIQPVFGGNPSDVFVAKFNPQGSALLYSTFLGGTSSNAGLGEYAYGLVLDGRGNAYVAGYTFATDFPLAGASYQASNRGNFDAFIAVISDQPATLPSPTPSPTATLTSTPNPQLTDFALEVSPLSQTIRRGRTTFYSIELTALNGFSGDVQLSVSGLPSRTTGDFVTNPVSLGPNAITRYSRLDITTQKNTPTGTYTLTLTASGGGKTHTQQVTLIINR